MSLASPTPPAAVRGSEQFAAWLMRQPRVGDGAMGTMLQRAGLPLEGCPEVWNQERPETVRAVHAAYREAGAEVLQTNSFGGSRFRLERAGLGDRVAEVNAAAVRLAREACGSGDRLIAGTIGPAAGWRPAGPSPAAGAGRRLEDAFAEQAAALAAAGVDLFLIETMTNAAEALIALKVVRAHTARPVVVTLVFGREGRTVDGRCPAEAAGLLAEAGAAAAGANCGAPAELLPILTLMRAAHPTLPLFVQPSAGLPRLAGGVPRYDLAPAAMARWARRLVDAGANLVGGCCGTTPAHIRAIREALDGRMAPRRARRDTKGAY